MSTSKEANEHVLKCIREPARLLASSERVGLWPTIIGSMNELARMMSKRALSASMTSVSSTVGTSGNRSIKKLAVSTARTLGEWIITPGVIPSCTSCSARLAACSRPCLVSGLRKSDVRLSWASPCLRRYSFNDGSVSKGKVGGAKTPWLRSCVLEI